MPKESVLTQNEKASAKIEKFIFHIIIESELNPIFLDEVDLTDEQLDFFRLQFLEAAEGTQFDFNDNSTSEVYKNCEKIIENPNENFFNISKDLTASFKSHHKKNMNDGVFITALVSINGSNNLIFLLKLDNRKVFEYKRTGNKAILEEIKNTFVEDKRSIQKLAIIDVTDYYKWDVLAYDRSPGVGKTISDFFRNFLVVHEKETPTTLTTNTVKAITNWTITNRADLDPAQEISSYKNRVIDYLNNCSMVDFKKLIDRVIDDSDSSRKRKLKRSLKEFLEGLGLYGQSFKPSRSVLTASQKKNIRKTAEGIKIEWQGDANDVNIDIPNVPNSNDGFYHITIKTREIKVVN